MNWQTFLKGGLSSWLDGGNASSSNQATVPAQQTPTYTAPSGQPTPTPNQVGSTWTPQDTMLAAVAGVLVVALYLMRKG